MGHEYVEMKNSHAAIEAYRRAVGKGFFTFLVPFHSSSQGRRQSQGLQSMVWSWSGI